MAKKTEEKILERTYNVPLRKEYQKVPRWRRTEKAITALREFIAKHLKTEQVILSKELNQEVWKHGIQNPPHHVKVNVTKDEKGVARATVFGEKKESAKDKKKAQKAGAKKTAEAKKEAPKESSSEEQ